MESLNTSIRDGCRSTQSGKQRKRVATYQFAHDHNAAHQPWDDLHGLQHPLKGRSRNCSFTVYTVNSLQERVDETQESNDDVNKADTPDEIHCR